MRHSLVVAILGLCQSGNREDDSGGEERLHFERVASERVMVD